MGYSYAKLSQDGMNIHYIQFPKSAIRKISFDVCTQPSLAPQKMLATYEETPNIMTNLGFFDMSTGNSILNFKSNGVVYSSDGTWPYGWGIKENGNIDIGFAEAEGWDDFVSGFPVLIWDGSSCDTSKASGVEGNYHRNIWGIENDYIFNIIIEGAGATFSTCQKLIKQLFPNCQYAFNMDGGGSVAAYEDGVRISDPGWERPVDSVCSVWFKKMQSGYRCQLGFFGNKDNAYRFRDTVTQLKSSIPNFSYSSAFVTYDEIMKGYRVQVGFFTKKEGAEAVKLDLQNLGYNCYIRATTIEA
jgi:hypothetical protein